MRLGAKIQVSTNGPGVRAGVRSGHFQQTLWKCNHGAICKYMGTVLLQRTILRRRAGLYQPIAGKMIQTKKNYNLLSLYFVIWLAIIDYVQEITANLFATISARSHCKFVLVQTKKTKSGRQARATGRLAARKEAAGSSTSAGRSACRRSLASGGCPSTFATTMERQRRQCGCENFGCAEAEGGRPPLDTGCAAQVARNTRSSARSQMNFAALGFQAVELECEDNETAARGAGKLGALSLIGKANEAEGSPAESACMGAGAAEFVEGGHQHSPQRQAISAAQAARCSSQARRGHLAESNVHEQKWQRRRPGQHAALLLLATTTRFGSLGPTEKPRGRHNAIRQKLEYIQHGLRPYLGEIHERAARVHQAAGSDSGTRATSGG